jgi:hypothetical protein
MKKHLLILIIGIFISTVAVSQTEITTVVKQNIFTIQEDNVIGKFNKNVGSNIYTISFSYSRLFNPLLSGGLGIGVGTGNPIKYTSSHVRDNGTTENSIVIPLFVQLKVRFMKKPTTPFVQGVLGYNIGSVEGFDGEAFNPYGVVFRLVLGGDINIGAGNKLTLGLGIHNQRVTTQDIKYKYSSLLQQYVYDSFNKQSNGFVGILAFIGISF